jgi:LysR family glycine cleavage system transcriptional activator
MRRLPPLSALRAFEAAARRQSFKQAAAELGVTPTAISHQIRQLEERLGVALFERQTRKVILTTQGRTLYPPLNQSFDTIAETLATLKRPPLRKLATLSATVAFTAKLLVPRAGSFRTRHPGWDLRLHASDDVVDLHAGEADAGVRYGRGRYPGLVTLPLLTDSFAPVCSPHLPVRKPEDLVAATLIHFEWSAATAKLGMATWARWNERARISRLEAESGITFNDESSAIQATIAGQGVALLSLTLVAAELASGALIQPFGPVLKGGRHDFVYPIGADERPAIAVLRDWVLAEFGATDADSGR